MRRAIVLLALGLIACRPAHAPYTARDPQLRRLPLYLYPADPAGQPPLAFVFFFGNDIGFWKPHQELAERLAAEGVAVAGLDVRPLLRALPDGVPAERERAWMAAVEPIVEGARHELGADKLPLVLGGHSLGAELALWTAAHGPPSRLVGVLAMAPRTRGHLRATLADIANTGEPREPGSFGIAEQIAALPPGTRVALVRGSHDKHAPADSLLAAAGGARAAVFTVPLAGHSLRRLTLAWFVVNRAMTYLLATRQGPGRESADAAASSGLAPNCIQ